MICPACQDFERNRNTGSYCPDCLECSTRHLAQGPLHFESRKARNITQAYRVELDKMEKIFGLDWESVHINAKRYFGLIKGRP